MPRSLTSLCAASSLPYLFMSWESEGTPVFRKAVGWEKMQLANHVLGVEWVSAQSRPAMCCTLLQPHQRGQEKGSGNLEGLDHFGRHGHHLQPGEGAPLGGVFPLYVPFLTLYATNKHLLALLCGYEAGYPRLCVFSR